jgi:hypothetical protein
MNMKPPDRFARVVKQAYLKNHVNDGMDGTVWTKETAALLRHQHRAYVRLVLALRLRARKAAFATVLAKKRPDWHDAKIEGFDDALAALTRYAKGKP